jgi:hypothetical protein
MAKLTKTSLSVPVQVKIAGLGVLVVADAHVTTQGNGNPVGTVQFKDGNTNIGGPVPMTGGHATLIAFRPVGSHVTAVFIPANPAAFKPSTSNTVTVTGRNGDGDHGNGGGNTGDGGSHAGQ